MELLIVFINDEHYLDELLSGFVELDVRHVAQFDSEGLVQSLAADVPIFAGLRQLFEQQERTPSRTILALLEEEETFDRLARLFKELDINFADPDVGCMFTVPVGRVAGE